MPTFNTTLTVAPFIAATIAASATLSLAQTAGQPAGVDTAALGAAATTGAAELARASKLLEDGRLVEAKAVLLGLFSDGSGLDEAGQHRAASMLKEANQRLKLADPLEVSLQKAELALTEADVRTAELHASMVLKNKKAGDAQTKRAKALMDQVRQRRAELAPVVPEMLAQAEQDFLAGRYVEAKTGLSAVYRSGVELTEEQQAKLDTYQLQIIDLERSKGSLMGEAGSPGMMQPGMIRRRDDQPAEQPTAQPAEQPADAPIEIIEEQPEPPPAEDQIQQAMRLQAQDTLAAADRAYDGGRLNEAANRYRQLLREDRQFLTPEQVMRAEQRLADAEIRLEAQGGGTQAQPLQDFLSDIDLERQRVRAEFANLTQQAQTALAAGNADRAEELTATAQLLVNGSRNAFPESELQNFDTQLTSLRQNIAQQRAEIARREQEAREVELREAQQRIQETAREARERQINELLNRARAYQAEMRYEEALQAVDQVLFLDRTDPAALLLKDVLTDVLFYTRWHTIQRQKQAGYAINSIENEDATIPPPGIVNFPADWPTISLTRGEPISAAEPPENRAVIAELEQRRIPSVQFQDNTLEDVIDFVETITQLNIDVDWASLEEAGIERETPVSLNLQNVSARTLLDRVMEKVSTDDALGGADWAVLDGILTIASEQRIRRNTTLQIYDISDLLIEVPDYDQVPEIDLQSVLQSSEGGGGQSPFTEDEEDEDEEEQERRRQERIDTIVEIITSNVDFEGWIDNGGDTGKIQRLDNSLIITNTPRNHQAISGLLGQLRQIRAMQINVETRFLLVNQDWFEQIGFDIDVILNANNNQVRAAQQVSPQTNANNFFGPGGRYAGGLVVSPAVDLNGDGDTQDPGEAATSQYPGARAAPWSPIGFGQNSLGLANGLAPASDFAGAILQSNPALAISGQFLDDIQVDFLIQATQADRRSIQLTAPRLTFTNGQIANIYVVTQQAFVSDLEPVTADSAVGFDPEVDSVSEGVTLLIEGTITADRRYVTMNVDAGVSRIDGFAREGVTAVAGGQLVSSEDVQSFIQLPTVTVTRVRTTVTVPDQGTLLIGGQRLITEFEVETGVPVLSKLPVLNRFFTNRIEAKEEQTLLILLKPTILIMSEQEERAHPGLLEQMRLGSDGL